MNRKLAELINIIFGFRKFLALIVLFVVGMIFRVKGYINGAEMIDLFKNITVSFFAANGVEHIMTAVKEFATNKAKTAIEGKVEVKDAKEDEDVNLEMPEEVVDDNAK